MAVSTSVEKVIYYLNLAVGDKVYKVSLGTIKATAADDDKALAIASALLPCLDGSFSKLTKSATTRIEEE